MADRAVYLINAGAYDLLSMIGGQLRNR
ncbi:hypothetical protein SPHINGOT1_250020 [Sphingomonas sp. T1]|nr:hypothetical protein SPHINGOT1_250020 [Sphingomonas sp. T1]